jgi:outer membrane receptor protein involved in Fe transport
MRAISRIALLALSATALTTPAFAQAVITPQTAAPTPPQPASTESEQADPQTAGEGETSTVDEIVVTGSRIATNGFQTPTPVTTLTSEAIEARAASNLTELLQDIPTVRPGTNTGNSVNIGAAAFDMRSLGSIRTLTMIDGRRAMDSNPANNPIFDINLVPGGLIKSMEIVTAGASSVYGSDAVTGVVNILMDSKMTGFKFDAQAGISEHGDAHTRSVDIAYGRELFGGRGHGVFAASYYERPDILYQGARDWGQTGYTLLTNPGYTATNGQYRQLLLPGATQSRVNEGGLIIGATTTGGAAANTWAFRNTQFGVNGAQSPLVLGNYVGGVWMQGGGGIAPQPDFGTITQASKRTSAFGRLTYDFTDKVQGFGELLYAESEGYWTNTVNYDSGTIVITRDNAYLPANILASMVANNIASFTMGRMNSELGRVHLYTSNRYIRPVIGLSGRLNDVWKWDASAVFTRAEYSAETDNNRIESRWNLAKDAVRVTAANVGASGLAIGSVACRSTLTTPTNGCIPVNLFGENTITPEARAWLIGTSHNDTTANGLDASVNLTGQLYHTWAGPIGVSVGAEYRREDIDLQTDPIAAIGGWRQGVAAPYTGELDVKELYGEATIPLLVDAPFAQAVDLNIAGRTVEYSTSGRADVWKVGANWTVNDQLRFRGTISRDFRAPRLSELFAANFEVMGAVVIDRTNNTTASGIRQVSGGNPNLQPEIGDTKTVGVIFEPGFMPNLRVSVDYFNIQLDNAITTLTPQEVVDRCFLGAQEFCAGIGRDSFGTINRINTVSYNATYLKTQGVDIAATYRVPVEAFIPNAGGDLSFSANFTYTDSLETLASGVVIDRAGQVTTPGVPHWRGAMRATYADGPVNISILANYIGEGKYDATYGQFDLDKNDYPSYVYYAVNAAYDLTETANVFVKVDNLFDTDPPFLSGNAIIKAQAAGGGGYYDQIGRYFTVGVRLKF